ncbi:hypothetical protein ABIA25_005793 [Sinorhizobium fredii]
MVGCLKGLIRCFGHTVQEKLQLAADCFCLEAKEIGQRRLRALDLGGKDSLLAYIHVQEQFLVPQQDGNAIKSSQSAFGGAESR